MALIELIVPIAFGLSRAMPVAIDAKIAIHRSKSMVLG